MSKYNSEILTDQEIDSLLSALDLPKEDSSSIKITHSPVNKVKLTMDVIEAHRYQEKHESWTIADEIDYIYQNAGKQIEEINLKFLNEDSINFSLINKEKVELSINTSNISDNGNNNIILNKLDLMKLNMIIYKLMSHMN